MTARFRCLRWGCCSQRCPSPLPGRGIATHLTICQTSCSAADVSPHEASRDSDHLHNSATCRYKEARGPYCWYVNALDSDAILEDGLEAGRPVQGTGIQSRHERHRHVGCCYAVRHLLAAALHHLHCAQHACDACLALLCSACSILRDKMSLGTAHTVMSGSLSRASFVNWKPQVNSCPQKRTRNASDAPIEDRHLVVLRGDTMCPIATPCTFQRKLVRIALGPTSRTYICQTSVSKNYI
jgi:hypothetical protein